jgi:hypothetical protein
MARPRSLPPDATTARRRSASPVTTEENTMLTNQVRELTSDLSQIARKHDGRDLTKAAIVELFASEACSIINPVHPDSALESVLRHLQRAVEITAGMPQTVDAVEEPTTDAMRRRVALRRLGQNLSDAMDEASILDWRDITKALLQVAQVALTPDDPPINRLNNRKVYDLVQQALIVLDEDRGEEAA